MLSLWKTERDRHASCFPWTEPAEVRRARIDGQALPSMPPASTRRSCSDAQTAGLLSGACDALLWLEYEKMAGRIRKKLFGEAK